jgi:hypothetical protein
MVMWVLLAVGRWPLAVGRWPLAVGRWPLTVGCLVLLLARIEHNSRNSIHAHTQHIFSGLKYLDWSKIYSACLDMLNKI